MPLWLNETDVRALLPMPDLIDAMQTALAAFSAGQVNQPVRSVIEVAPGHSFFASMPAHAGSIPALGAKLVTVFAGNASRNLPTHLATIVLLDPQTGELLGVMDGRFITEARTAAVSAVAVRHLAREQAFRLAIIGSGVQARSHLEALAHVRPFQEARCWSPTAGHVRKLAAESHPIPVRAAESAQAAVVDADVVVLATASPVPVIEDAWISPGACVVSVGACRPNQREMDPVLVARARLFVDSRAAALRESGDVIMAISEDRFSASHIVAELGEAVTETRLCRADAGQVVVFKSLGLAVEDLAAAHLVYQRALEANRGAPLS